MSTYVKKDNPVKVGTDWFQKINVYLNDSLNKSPIRVINKKVSPEYVESNYPNIYSPKKTFQTGHIHALFDPTSQEYTDFAGSSLTSEFFNNQELSMSSEGIDFRIGAIVKLYTDGVIQESTKDSIVSLFNSWKLELGS